ncbi:hypothetical protein NMG60_11024660 [Bertholletia excelsa]
MAIICQPQCIIDNQGNKDLAAVDSVEYEDEPGNVHTCNKLVESPVRVWFADPSDIPYCDKMELYLTAAGIIISRHLNLFAHTIVDMGSELPN